MSKMLLNVVKTFALMIVTLAMFACVTSAQTASSAPTTAVTTVQAQTTMPEPARATTQEKAPRRPIKRVPAPPARVTVIPSQAQVAPQVVTIVHRLSGIKILRLLLRQAGENGMLETIDPATFARDAHASIIAGWALDDGRTIAARLPQVAAELEFPEVSSRAELDARAIAASTFPPPSPRVEPDLTVITGDGRKMRARLIGLDAETGLSVLQIIGPVIPLTTRESMQKLATGQGVQIFAPERTTPESEALSRTTYVRVGKVDATVSKLVQASSGSLETLTARSEKLSPALIGGVACDQSGNTVGIVESIEGSDARIVSANRVRAATRRVLDRKASVPRPLLGVRGEPVEFAARTAFLAHGWRNDQLPDLVQAQVGILLTLVVPKTPAALAKLQPGDVIVRVNQNDVKSAEEFSKLLGQAGSGEQVEFTVKRPDATAPLSIPVRLGGSFAPVFEWRFEMSRATTPFMGLQAFGMETMALTARAASQLGAQNGLLVVAVQPQSAAARGGLREGDVIESIDGRTAARAFAIGPQFSRQKKHTLSIVREREKKRVVLEVEE